MKAATAQKLAVNMISTTAMIRLGRVTGNFMTAMHPGNDKLRRRARFIVGSICNVDEEVAEAALVKCNLNIKEAVNLLRNRSI